MLLDNHNRPINYIRVAVTDRCNLRCTYCMPEQMQFVKQNKLFSYEELYRSIRLLSTVGVSKVRITGGEPFLRKDLIPLIDAVMQLDGIEKLSITTNGLLTKPYIPTLKALGVDSVNLSLDTLEKDKFFRIARRNEFDKVMATLEALLESGIRTKLNMVIMGGVNDDEILEFVDLTRSMPLDVRFIEEMPFNGSGNGAAKPIWDHERILKHISSLFTLEKLVDAPHATALNYAIQGHIGTIGLIPAYTRSFCGDCNRIRLTATGGLKTCLYGADVLNIKSLLLDGIDDESLLQAIRKVVGQRYINGFEAEKFNFGQHYQSMSLIGG